MPIALEAIEQGYEVHIATTITNKLKILENSGVVVHSVNFKRGKLGVTIFSEFRNLLTIIRNVSPDIVHLVTIKPVLLGGIASRVAKVPSVVSAISGLGFVFSDHGFLSFLRKKMVLIIYFFALGNKNQKVIFQNNSDKFEIKKIIRNIEDKSVLLPGSGVDLKLFSFTKHNATPPFVVMMASRLLARKGVREFVLASKILNDKNVKFVIVGDIDPLNPESIKQSELNLWKEYENLELWGFKKDMHNIIPKADIMVFPSYYGEGLPKILSESAACGRAIITTDHPGCRDAITQDTGVLIPIKDSVSLANAIKSFIDDPKKMVRMGRLGRMLAKEKFDIKKICKQHLKIYKSLLDKVD